MRSVSRLWLLPILALSAFLDFWRLGAKSLWVDEIHTYRFATMPVSEFWDLVVRREANMVLYYLLLRGWLAVGDSEAWMRGLSAVFAVGATAAVHALVAQLYGRQTALIAALLFAINPMVIAYAQEARGYALFLLLAVTATLLFVRAIEGGRREWLLYVLVASLVPYSHLFGGLVLVAHGVAGVTFVPREMLPWRRLIAMGVAVGLLVSPLMVFVANVAPTRPLRWIAEPGARQFVGIFAALAGSKWLLAIYGPLVLVAVVVFAREWTRRVPAARRWPFFLLLAWLLGPPAVAFGISQVQPILVPRFYISGIAPLVTLAAVALERIRSRAVSMACGLALVGLTLPALVAHYRSEKEAWRSVIQHVVAHVAPADAVVFYTGTGLAALAYYTRQQAAPAATLIAPAWNTPADMKQHPDLAAITRCYPRVWLVLSHVSAGSRGTVRVRIQDLLGERYRSMRGHDFKGVQLQIYDNPR